MALMRRLTFTTLLCAVLLGIGVPAAAADDPFGDRVLPIELVMAYRKQIDLTPAQSKQLGELVVALQTAVAAKQWEMQSTYFELLEALDAPTIDEAKATALARSAIDIENDIKIEQLRLLIRLRNLLNAKQIDYLRARLAEGWKKEP
jgi:Spy/CpxP family protein refolding chaperone